MGAGWTCTKYVASETIRGVLMLDLDRALEAGQPSSAVDDPRVNELAVLLAQQVGTSDEVPAARRKHRVKLIGGFALSLVLVGGAAAAAAPALMEWPPWEPDAMVEREFPVSGDEDASCMVVARVVPDDATAGSDQGARLDRARDFLETHDWSSLQTLTIADIPADELEGPRRQGMADQMILTMQISDQIGEAFDAGGYLGDGVSLEQAGRCSPKDPE